MPWHVPRGALARIVALRRNRCSNHENRSAFLLAQPLLLVSDMASRLSPSAATFTLASDAALTRGAAAVALRLGSDA
jgi:hypothetical protein